MSALRLSEFILQRIGFEHTNRNSGRHVLRCGITTVGRGLKNDLHARTEYAGRNHCVIRVEDNRVLVKDNESVNGTFINTVRIGVEKELQIGDTLSIGCNVSLSDCYERDDFLVYRLTKISSVSTEVELLSDDEIEVKMEKIDCVQHLRTPNLSQPTIDSSCEILLDESLKPIDLLSDDESIPTSIANIKNEFNAICLESDEENERADQSDLESINDDMEHMEIDMPICFQRELKQEMQDIDEYLSQMNEKFHGDVLNNSPLHESSPVRESPPLEGLSIQYDMHSNISNSSVESISIKTEPMSQTTSFWPEEEIAPIEIIDDDDDYKNDVLNAWLDRLVIKEKYVKRPVKSKRKNESYNGTERPVSKKVTTSNISHISFPLQSPSNLGTEHLEIDIPHSKPLNEAHNVPACVTPASISMCVWTTKTFVENKDKSNSKCAEGDNKPRKDQEVFLDIGENSANAAAPSKLITKRRQSMCILIDAKPMPKRRQSISASGNKKTTLINKKILKQDELQAKNKKPFDGMSDKKCADLHKIRKSKLKSIAQANKSVTNSVVRASIKPKVKNTQNSRSCFLTDGASIPPLPQSIKNRKWNVSIDAKKTKEKIKASIESTSHRLQSTSTFFENKSASIEEATHLPLQIQMESSSSSSNIKQLINDPQHIFPSVIPNIFEPLEMYNAKIMMSLENYTIINKPQQKPVKSILANKANQRPKRNIRFDTNGPTVFKFCAEEKRNTPQDPIQTIISDITSWPPDWLYEKNALIHGYGFEPSPMVHNYQSFDSYLATMIPIMKLELWENIRNEFKLFKDNPAIHVTKNTAFLDTRGASERYVIHCEAEQTNQKGSKQFFTYHDLVLITFGEGSQSQKFFAIITAYRVTYIQSRPFAFFSMEASPEVNTRMPANTFKMTVGLVSRLKGEINMFRSIYQLEKSPLLLQILSPKSFPLKKDSSSRGPFVYRGYDKLNVEQDLIVRHISDRVTQSTPSITLIDGPPGTGKSRVITNLLMQLIHSDPALRPRKLIVCAHSNAAVDVICRKLDTINRSMHKRKNQGFSLVRFGMLDKMHRAVRHLSLENQCKKKQSLAELRQERITLKLKLSACELSTPNLNGIDSNLEAVQLRERISKIEQAITLGDNTDRNSKDSGSYKHCISNADVICTTLGSCMSLQQYLPSVDICIVDEATQCPEPSTLIPVSYGIKSLVLVGDTQQLPGTVQSQKAKSLGYSKSLFDRIQGSFGQISTCPVFQLNVQYRMDPEICRWPSTFFYQDRITTDIRGRRDILPLKPYTVICMESKQTEHTNLPGKHCLYNTDEAEFIIRMLHVLAKKISHDQFSIGIITPYAQQKEQLNKRFNDLPFKFLSANTVDAYQGQEKDIIILSTVRSSGVGFLNVSERLNVALTRAKRCLIVCGNFQSLMINPVWHSMLTNARERNLMHTLVRENNDELFELKITDILMKKIETKN